MRPITSTHFLLLLLPWLPFTNTQPLHSRSPKRGLVYVSTPHSIADSPIWTRAPSDLTWYYNYSPYPSTSFPHLDFAPMLFSIPTDDSFSTQITSILKTNAGNGEQTQILAFNEPDGPTDQGGTDLKPDAAAKTYLDMLVPLLSSYPGADIQLGWPAVTGSPRGLTWLADFNKSCYALAPKTGCPASFLPVHWYGDFEGLAGYISQVHALYPGLSLWVTEFADPNVDLEDSQGFFNQSISFLDKAAYVDRYAYFGGFRSQDSNVGGQGVMLDKGGQLTEIGEWYLGKNGTGKDPDSGVGRVSGGRGLGYVFMGVVLGWVVVVCNLK